MFSPTLRALTIAASVLCTGLTATAQFDGPPSAGDVNLDGETNILDVQGAISQALGASAVNAEADIDGNAQVNVFDVQQLVNTSLGVGGLIQRVRGVINCGCDAAEIRVVAVSRDGRRIVAEADPVSGEFVIGLRTRTVWSLGVCVRLEGEIDFECIGTVDFPLGDAASVGLPLFGLSRGGVLDIGELSPVNERLRVGENLLRLLARLERPFNPADNDENGVPDFVEPLLRRVLMFGSLPDDFDVEELLARVGACLSERTDEVERPSLADDDGNLFPDFVERPYLECLTIALRDYLGELTGETGSSVERTVIRIRNLVLEGTPEWLSGLNLPETMDENMNGLPDRIELFLILALGESTRIDRDGNLVPDFLEDHDDDGVPNYLDEDWRSRPDANDPDGDGIDNDDDLDDDNDGVPDYADTDGVNVDAQGAR